MIHAGIYVPVFSFMFGLLLESLTHTQRLLVQHPLHHSSRSGNTHFYLATRGHQGVKVTLPFYNAVCL